MLDGVHGVPGIGWITAKEKQEKRDTTETITVEKKHVKKKKTTEPNKVKETDKHHKLIKEDGPKENN